MYLCSKIYTECTMRDARLRKDALYILPFGMLLKRLKVIIWIVLLPPLSYWWKKSHGHLLCCWSDPVGLYLCKDSSEQWPMRSLISWSLKLGWCSTVAHVTFPVWSVLRPCIPAALHISGMIFASLFRPTGWLPNLGTPDPSSGRGWK